MDKPTDHAFDTPDFYRSILDNAATVWTSFFAGIRAIVWLGSGSGDIYIEVGIARLAIDWCGSSRARGSGRGSGKPLYETFIASQVTTRSKRIGFVHQIETYLTHEGLVNRFKSSGMLLKKLIGT